MNIQLFDYSINLLRVLLWQYNEAENVEGLLTLKQQWYNQAQRDFWQNWFTNVFNLDTANDFGLSVWSIILGIPLQIGQAPEPSDKPLFGFGSETMTPNNYLNFENGNFSSAETFFTLTTEEKRIVLKLRYYQLISNAAIPGINRSLSLVFKNYPGKVYVIDRLNMSIRVIFTFDPGVRLLYIIKYYDLIPRGQGVGIEYIVNPGDLFGFGSEILIPNNYKNFENGNFIQEG